MKKVLWVSRHQMTPEQLADLERVMQDQVELLQYKDTLKTVDELKPLLPQVQAIAVVLPLEMVAQLMPLAGDRPVLQSVSRRIPSGRMLHLADGRAEEEFVFEHNGWQQIVHLQLQLKLLS
ncbi:hypothetical protein B5E65_05420 [Gemmiger sp. An120]|uniref:hypothetical protein n=1 Tax=Gemmiger sp. An120 TaxID=1965549 RepID=UPI000B39A0FB|nr:hypothetical protein [Gemmiger sp. An120]OUQ43214.1 hypothetical protein B5E65_05420 [Gemmiger sp. An120]